MDVILIKDYKSLGVKDDIVTVSDGYAINFLVKKGFAIIATQDNLNRRRERILLDDENRAKIMKEATSLKFELEDLFITIKRRGNELKLFGAVSSSNISDFLKEKGFNIPKKDIEFNKTFSIGVFEAIVNCGGGVKAYISVNIEKEN